MGDLYQNESLEYEDLNQIQMLQRRVHWKAVANTTVNLSISMNRDKFPEQLRHSFLQEILHFRDTGSCTETENIL